MSAESDIRALVTGWVDAVRAQDLDGLVAHHADDIVMFDVRSPHQGVRGIAEYRDCWGPFFEWQRTEHAVFELVELNVEAGADVAFAYALLRCGTPADLEANPDNRLRITIGVRRIGDQWTVMHEHHSFPWWIDPSAALGQGTQEEGQVGGPLGQSADEVSVPLRAERHVHAHVVAVVDEPALLGVADAVQHLILEIVDAAPELGRQAGYRGDDLGIVRGHHRVTASSHQHP
jgi:ketosteroid isomerase-like protein